MGAPTTCVGEYDHDAKQQSEDDVCPDIYPGAQEVPGLPARTILYGLAHSKAVRARTDERPGHVRIGPCAGMLILRLCHARCYNDFPNDVNLGSKQIDHRKGGGFWSPSRL